MGGKAGASPNRQTPDTARDAALGSGQRVCIGAFAGAHGVKGEVRLKSFTENPEDIGAYGPLLSEDGRRVFTIDRLLRQKGDMLIARILEVDTREEALDLKGARLYVDRDKLPSTEEDEFYYEDLVGLRVVHVDGRDMGEVRAVFDHGAGDLLEIWHIPGVKGARLIPFTKEMAPTVDLKAGRVVIDPPEELLE